MPKYAIDEILELTLEKEIMRRDFYAEAAKKFADPKTNKLFKDLKAWEDVHVEKITELKERLKTKPIIDSSLGEVKAYLRSVVDSELYASLSVKDFVKAIKNEKEAVDAAVGFEKDAILFFNEFLSLTSGKDKTVIGKLIDEEKKHIQYLLDLKDKL